MRLAPAPLAFANDPEQAIRIAGLAPAPRTRPECVDACRYSRASSWPRCKA